MQAKYIKSLKENIKFEECLIHEDFAENYAIFIQDAIHANHWDNKQVTVFPAIVYYRDEDNIVKSKTFVCLSNSTKHDNDTVSYFNELILNQFLRGGLNISHCHYLTDGAVTQFKNFKQIINLCMHEEDYGCTAQNHFFATAHGKSEVDAVGGRVKRAAKRASIQGEVIRNVRELHAFVAKKFTNISFFHVSENDLKKHEKKMKTRTRHASTVKGTRSAHSFTPVKGALTDMCTVELRRVSSSLAFQRRVVSDVVKQTLLLH